MSAASDAANEYATIVGAIAAALVACGIIWKKAIRPTARSIRILIEAVGRIADATPTLLVIAQEFEANGGSTLRDSIDRIEDNQKSFNGRLDVVERKMDRISQQQQESLDSHRAIRAHQQEIKKHGELMTRKVATELDAIRTRLLVGKPQQGGLHVAGGSDESETPPE